jgi:hypothetical protein
MRQTTPRVGCCLLLCVLLAACNSTEATLDPSSVGTDKRASAANALAPQETANGVATPGATGAVPPQTANLAQADVRLQFAPVVGATVQAATPLAQRISARASQRGMAITAGGANPPTHLVKGYFSAITEGGQTMVIFVWDVLDPAGNRLHRIQGQETVGAVAPDPWSAVPAATMETIAERTIDDLSGWLASQSG